MTKSYKPGQFISLGGKLYRVSREKSLPCILCPLCPKKLALQWMPNPNGYYPDPNECKLRVECGTKLPLHTGTLGSHPIPLKPKRQG